jgi:hypothetical protein
MERALESRTNGVYSLMMHGDKLHSRSGHNTVRV